LISVIGDQLDVMTKDKVFESVAGKYSLSIILGVIPENVGVIPEGVGVIPEGVGVISESVGDVSSLRLQKILNLFQLLYFISDTNQSSQQLIVVPLG